MRFFVFSGDGRFYFFSSRYCVSFHGLEFFRWTELHLPIGQWISSIFIVVSTLNMQSNMKTCTRQARKVKQIHSTFLCHMNDNEPLSIGFSIGFLCFGQRFWCSSLALSIYCISRPVELGQNADRGGKLSLGRGRLCDQYEQTTWRACAGSFHLYIYLYIYTRMQHT